MAPENQEMRFSEMSAATGPCLAPVAQAGWAGSAQPAGSFQVRAGVGAGWSPAVLRFVLSLRLASFLASPRGGETRAEQRSGRTDPAAAGSAALPVPGRFLGEGIVGLGSRSLPVTGVFRHAAARRYKAVHRQCRTHRCTQLLWVERLPKKITSPSKAQRKRAQGLPDGNVRLQK